MTLPDPRQESVSGIEFAMYENPAQRWFDGINREVDAAMPPIGEPDCEASAARGCDQETGAALSEMA